MKNIVKLGFALALIASIGQVFADFGDIAGPAIGGAAIGGIAGGGRGAAIGAGVGAGLGILGSASRERRYYNDPYYYDSYDYSYPTYYESYPARYERSYRGYRRPGVFRARYR